MTYDPLTTARRYATPPPHAVYAAKCLDGGWFGRCDGCGWCGELVDLETDAWADAIKHMLASEETA